jgi:exodeoxyribonuclease VII large subunit
MSDLPARSQPAQVELPTSITAPVIPVSLLNRLARERLNRVFPCAGSPAKSPISPTRRPGTSTSRSRTAPRRCAASCSAVRATDRLATGQRPAHRSARAGDALRGPRRFPAQRRSGSSQRRRQLYEQFLRLKEKLAGEGLFDSAGKRPLPAFPRRVGVVTSLQAAALRDVLSDTQAPRRPGGDRRLPDAGAGRRRRQPDRRGDSQGRRAIATARS